MASVTTDLHLYELLRQKMGSAEAEALVCLVDSKLTTAEERNAKLLAAKEDLSKVDSSLKQEIKNLEIRLTEQIGDSKIATIRWVFGVFVAMLLMMVGLYFKK